MKKIFSVLKRDMYLELLGVLIAIILSIMIYIKIEKLIISVLIGLLICAILVYIINRGCLLYIVTMIEKRQRKYKCLDSQKIRGLDSKIDEIINLDNELINFLDKYSSGKKTDLREKKLNKQWAKKGDYFVEKAHSLFLNMNNEELLISLLSTEHICHIVDIFDYFNPFLINVDYLLKHPERRLEAYYVTLSNHQSLKDILINPYYLQRLEEINCFEEIEKFILSNMSNKQIIELSNKSKDWNEKLYLYGYLKKF